MKGYCEHCHKVIDETELFQGENSEILCETCYNNQTFLELCGRCLKGKITHPKLYTYKCNFCGFEYEINPNSRKDSVRIINEGLFGKAINRLYKASKRFGD